MNKSISILGAGESGVGAAILAKKHEFNVFVSDKHLIKESYKKKLAQNNIDFEEGKHTVNKILESDLIVKSPGIPNENELIKKIVKNKKNLLSEIEFAHSYTKAKIIAITGTNGKTTTSLIIYKILKDAGLDVLLAGNIGNSFSYEISKRDYDIIVLEVSSFQLDNIVKFSPHISILLNITPDHLDRYNGDLKNYIK